MGAMEHFKEGMGQFLHTIEDGWHEFSRRAREALTQFRPAADDDRSGDTSATTSRWGLLAADVRDELANVVVRIEAPGMEMEDFDIEVLGRALRIRGEKRSERTDTRGGYHIRECAYGHFRRDILLPAEVDDAKAKATYRRGVLEVKLPKMKAANTRQIKVRASG